MNKKYFALIAFAVLIVISGRIYAQNQETRDLASFSRLSVGEAIKVYLKEGSTESAKIEVKGIDLDEVLTETSGSKLRIHLERGNHRNVDVKIWLTYVNLEEIDISSAASVQTESVLRADNLKVEASSAGDGKLEVDVNELRVEVSSAADLVISGKAGTQDVSVSSSGSYYAYDLKCEESEVSASSAGSAKVTASKKIDASASSAGSIRYRGNPEKVYVSSSSGGSARKSN